MGIILCVLLTGPSPSSNLALHEDSSSKLTAVNLQILRNLWLPDVEILNLKAFETHSVLSKLEGVWIDDQHQLLYALATRITFICPMKFNAFPMDIQRCKFQVGRHSSTATSQNRIHYHWNEKRVIGPCCQARHMPSPVIDRNPILYFQSNPNWNRK